MTIKPVGNQKTSEKKDTHGHAQAVEQQTSGAVRSGHRSVVIDSHGQSPQRRGDVFDDIARHRRSPHKSGTRSKRDQLKRDREREKLSASNSPQYHQVLSNCSSPHAYNPAAGKSPEHVSLPSVVGQNPSPVHQSANLLNIIEETFSGYNSGDEHLPAKESTIGPDDWKSRDEQFAKVMSERGYVLKDIEEDGACLFRAISQQLYGDEEMHDVIRQQTMDYIQQNKEYFSQFVTEDISGYIKRKRRKDSHGNHIEIQAMSEIYNRPVELYCYKATPINIFNSEQLKNGYAPLRLSYQRGSHYNAILDPYNASVGVGLGLAGYKPESQTREAARMSENLEIEQTMFEDKLKTTDWEATNEAIEEQIARESYLQWCRDNIERTRNVPNTTSASCSAASGSMLATGSGTSTTTSSSSTVTSAEAAATIKNCSTSTSMLPQHSRNTTSCTVTKLSSLPMQASLEHSAASKEAAEMCDSDDTDMSSTSSLDHQLVEKRGKKAKSRSGGKSSRRRKLAEIAIEKKVENDTKPDNNQTKRSRQTPSPQMTTTTTPSFNATETSPPANKSPRRSATPVDKPNIEEIAPTTPVMQTANLKNTTPGTSKQSDALEEAQPLSQFYQSLLESSYADDGFGQLSENEMLQQALRMSTIDFFEDQKRKYNFNT